MRIAHFTLASALILLGTSSAIAGVAYSDNFDSGSSTFTADAYWLSNAECNGYIVKTDTSGSVCGGIFSAYPITNDASGSGYFLFDGTSGTVAGDQIYISPSFAVSPNTVYTVSFDLTNANNINVSQIQPDVNGTLLGSGPVSAAGYFTDGNPADQWQQLSFTWNSGASTTAVLTLHNSVNTSTGNDFGVDDILVTSGTPEPGTGAMLGGVFAIAAALLRRKRANR